MIKEILQNKLAKLTLGIAGIVSKTFFQFLDWGSGENPLHGGYYFILAFGLSGLGSFLLIDLKYNDCKISSNYAIFYPLVVIFLLNVYTNFYIIPEIEKQGEKVKGVV